MSDHQLYLDIDSSPDISDHALYLIIRHNHDYDDGGVTMWFYCPITESQRILLKNVKDNRVCISKIHKSTIDHLLSLGSHVISYGCWLETKDMPIFNLVKSINMRELSKLAEILSGNFQFNINGGKLNIEVEVVSSDEDEGICYGNQEDNY